jgi:hypothetical protein
MIEDVESRFSADLQRIRLPDAPDRLHDRILRIPAVVPASHQRSDRRPLLVLLAAALLATVAAVLLVSGGNQAPLPTPSESSQASPSNLASPRSIASASPHASASLDPFVSFPASVDGRPVRSVSEVLALRTEGRLPPGAVSLRGYWSDGSIGHSCTAPDGSPGELEIYCHDGEYGIAEDNEPVFVIDKFSRGTHATGPWLTPFVPEEVDGIAALFNLPIANGQRFLPVPILVVGHFDDPRASKCRPASRQLCKDRFVLDRIVQFDPASIPTPAPTPSPTPFPFADPPPPPFSDDECAPGAAIAFAGWKPKGDVPFTANPGDEVLYVVITKDPVPQSGWQGGADGAPVAWRTWGIRICMASESEPGVMLSFTVPGTAYREYGDGRRDPAPSA